MPESLDKITSDGIGFDPLCTPHLNRRAVLEFHVPFWHLVIKGATGDGIGCDPLYTPYLSGSVIESHTSLWHLVIDGTTSCGR